MGVRIFGQRSTLILSVAMCVASACSGDKTGDERGDSTKPGKRVDGGAESPNGSGDGGKATTASHPMIPRKRITDAGTPELPPESQPVAGPCGDECFEQGAGTGGDAFDPTMNPSESVGLDPDGALIIKRDPPTTAEYIWISDTGENTVSKIDIATMLEVARYRVGAVDPSRTSVSATGDAYVGSRNGKGVTKISPLGSACPDTNGDGVVTTSSGPGDLLAFGQDDCMMWFTAVDEVVRGVAAQDIPSETMITPQPDGAPLVTTTPEQHYVWVGGGTTSKIFKLDGETGQILLTTTAPRGVYGLALDGRGILWNTGGYYWGGSLGFIDTKQCVDDASCNVAACSVASCSTTVCPATCDGAVKGSISLSPGTASAAYGITVDCSQRVWLGGFDNPIKRYDPSAAADLRLAVAPATTNGVHGIAVDANGWVWGARTGSTMVRMDADTMTQVLGVAGTDSSKGVAVDGAGKVWGITQGTTAHVITPGPTLNDNTVATDAVTGLVSPYTYSDMTGVQLKLATNQGPGRYRQLLELACPDGHASNGWADLTWDVETPDKTWVVFQIRTANRVKDIEKADFIPLAGAPSMVNSVSIADALAREGVEPGKYLEIAVELYGATGSVNRCASDPDITPRVKSFVASFTCEPPPPPPPPVEPPPPPEVPQ